MVDEDQLAAVGVRLLQRSKLSGFRPKDFGFASFVSCSWFFVLGSSAAITGKPSVQLSADNQK